MIRITGYGVIAEKPRVGQLGRIFPCSLYEKLCVESKNESTFLMASTSSITMQSLGKIVQCVPAVGVCFFFVGHAPSLEHCAVKGCIVRTSIALPFLGRFRRDLQHFFSEWIVLSVALLSWHIRR